VLLHYEGQNIASGKVHLVANQKALELWAQESTNYPIPTLTIPSEEELEKRKEEEKKEKEKEKQEEPAQALQQQLKLKFQHKFLDHTEKITSLSMSQD
jgi:L-lysine 2,3-aminomutase